jgi:GxxExxY protein
MPQLLKRQDLLYPELSYQIVGCAFDVYNELGAGLNEKLYEKSLATALTKNNLKFKEQLACSITYNGKVIGRRFLDFFIEDKVIVETKKGDRFSKSHIDQVLEYLKINQAQLAILINFGANGVNFKRIINLT